MARDPGSVWAPLPEAGAPDGYVKTQFIVHSTGDNGLARSVRDNWFARTDVVVESTFIVGWGPSRDDPTLQIMDSTDNADANGSANQRGISIEVTGDGTGPFTAWQRSELIRLGLWARKTHGIVPRVIPSESAGGFGWHVMFGAPGPWTSVPGKVCPGAVRIGQLKSDIFPAIFAGADRGGFLMALTDAEQERLLTRVDWLFESITPGKAGLKNDSGAWRRWEDRIALLPGMAATLAEIDGADPGALAAAVSAALKPLLRDAVLEGMAADNEDQADEIVDRLAARLGSG